MTDDIPAIGASFQHQIDDHRSVVFQTHLPADCSLAEFTKQLGKLSAASDWLKAKTHLPTQQNLLAIKKEGLKKATEALFAAQSALDARYSQWSVASREAGRREWKMTPAQKQEEDRLKAEISKQQGQVRAAQQEILTDELLVADMERKLGASSNGASSTADSGAGVRAGEMPSFDFAGGAEVKFDP